MADFNRNWIIDSGDWIDWQTLSQQPISIYPCDQNVNLCPCGGCP